MCSVSFCPRLFRHVHISNRGPESKSRAVVQTLGPTLSASPERTSPTTPASKSASTTSSANPPMAAAPTRSRARPSLPARATTTAATTPTPRRLPLSPRPLHRLPPTAAVPVRPSGDNAVARGGRGPRLARRASAVRRTSGIVCLPIFLFLV